MKCLLIILTIIIAICVISWIADTHRFVIRRYVIQTDKIKRDMRFVLLTDLHNKEYGPDNVKLIKAICDQEPDAILIAGDIPDAIKGHSVLPAVKLVREMAAKYPVYYGFGNHEYRLKIYQENYGAMWQEYTAALDEAGVHIMDNERITLEDAGVEISAISIERRFYKRFKGSELTSADVTGYLGEAADGNDLFRLLIAHNPEYFSAYSEWGADLTVSGHVHGGIMRLPFLGGVISPRLSLFPKYSGGEYELDGNKMIVSCGLGTHSIHVRVFNPGELSVIELKTRLT